MRADDDDSGVEERDGFGFELGFGRRSEDGLRVRVSLVAEAAKLVSQGASMRPPSNELQKITSIMVGGSQWKT